MAAFYGSPLFRGFDLSSMLNPQGGDDVAALLEQGKRKGFTPLRENPNLKTQSFEAPPSAAPTSAPVVEPPRPLSSKPPMPEPTIPTWQSGFSDIERAGVTGQNPQSGLQASTGGVDLSKALGAAAKIFGQKKAEDKGPEPVKFLTPPTSAPRNVNFSLPDPITYALFGKPI